MLDDLIARSRKVEMPPWDDLREQRLLQGALEVSRRRTRRARKLKTLSVVGFVALLPMFALVVFMQMRSVRRDVSPTAAASIQLPRAVTPHSELTQGSWIRLGDGSRINPDADARYQVTEVTAERVRVVQHQGRIEYEVAHDPNREFLVRAADVTVRVTGTQFTVAFAGDWVSVHVDAGRVEVNDGARTTALLAGEDLRVHAWNAAGSPPAATSNARAQESPAPSAERTAVDTAASLLARADSARRAGNTSESVELLQSLVTRFPSDSRTAVAHFTLGRLYATQGRYGDAATAFARCRRVSAGSLAEDALAEQASASKKAGNVTEARVLGQKYLNEYPDGTHSKRMRALLQ